MRRLERTCTRPVIFQLQIAVIVSTYPTGSVSYISNKHYLHSVILTNITRLHNTLPTYRTVVVNTPPKLDYEHKEIFDVGTAYRVLRYKIMNYDQVGVGERLCCARGVSRRANETQGGARSAARTRAGRGDVGRVIIYEL